MTTPSLFDAPLPARLPARGRTPHSKTASVEAAVSVKAQAASDTARVLAYLEQRGQAGATDEELCQALGIQRHEVPARRSPLCEGCPALVGSIGRRAEGHGNRRIAVWAVLSAFRSEVA